jgi:hypothetical protein
MDWAHQVLADIGVGRELRRLSETEKRGRELTYNLIVAYPLFYQRVPPFVELNGISAVQAIRP